MMAPDDLRLLLDVATEACLGRAWVIRGVKKPARITPEPRNGKIMYHLTGQVESLSVPQKGGLLLLLYFPESDGGEPGIEEV